MPPFEHVLEKLKAHLQNTLPGLVFEMKTKFSLQFEIQGFQIDLLPAPNLGPTPIAQCKHTMNHLENIDPKNLEKHMRYWGPSLAEVTVEFMKKQPPFVNAAVRLCKLWKKTCKVLPSTFPTWFSSFLIETVAVYAANEELRLHRNDASLLRVLEAFFRMLSKPEELCLLGSHASRDIPPSIRKQRPLVLDPVNPKSNLAFYLQGWTAIKLIASCTLEKLRIASGSSNVSISAVFEPQLGKDFSFLYKLCHFQMRFVQNGSWIQTLKICKIADLHGKPMNPGFDWRSRSSLSLEACPEEVQSTMANNFHNFVEVTSTMLLHTVHSDEGLSETVVCSDFVDDMLHQVFGAPKLGWVSTLETHESRDISFTFGQVPIASTPGNECYIFLKLSTNLNEDQLYRMAYEIQREIERKNEQDVDDE